MFRSRGNMKIKSLERNPDNSQMEVSVMLSNQEIIFLKEVVKMYQDKRLGDIDDANIDKIKKELSKELHEAWKRMNPN